MTRHPRDENILLLAHGALPLWRSLWTQWHLRRCLQCQARYAALAQTSAALAAALRGPDAALWQPAAPAVSLRFAAISLAGLITLLCLFCGLFYFTLYVKQSPETPTGKTRPASEGCAPNLPDDRCR